MVLIFGIHVDVVMEFGFGVKEIECGCWEYLRETLPSSLYIICCAFKCILIYSSGATTAAVDVLSSSYDCCMSCVDKFSDRVLLLALDLFGDTVDIDGVVNCPDADACDVGIGIGIDMVLVYLHLYMYYR